jgi:hypothetical protein
MAEEIKKEMAEKKPSKVKDWFKRNKGKIMLIGGAIGGGVLGIFGIKKLGDYANDLGAEAEENFLKTLRPVRVLHADGNEEDGWLGMFDGLGEVLLPDTEKSVGRLAGTFDFSEFDWVDDVADKAAESEE